MAANYATIADIKGSAVIRLHPVGAGGADTTGFMGTPTLSELEEADEIFGIRVSKPLEPDISGLPKSGPGHKERFDATFKSMVPPKKK